MVLNWHKRFLIVAALLLALGGCSVSPAVDAVSWGVDGFSYLITGKSMTDHAMSAAAGKDCAMLRVVKGQKTCVPKDEDVAGDRLVFEFNESSMSRDESVAAVGGDPMSLSADMAQIAAPLGDSVQVETRPAAIAAVVSDSVPLNGLMGEETDRNGKPIFSALVKSKMPSHVDAPGRATRLWLPVE